MDIRESVCLFCPLGCDVAFRVRGEEVTGPEFCGTLESHAGRVCGRGLYGTELLNHPQRIATPLVREDGRLRESSWESALKRAAQALKGVIASAGASAIAVVTDATRSTAEIEAAERLAAALGTGAVSCAFEPQDWPLLNAGEGTGASAIEEASCVIVIGDVFASHPVLSKEIIEAKYTARGNSLFVLDPRRSNTAWYATTHLQNRPGTEALVLAQVLKAAIETGKTDASACSWVENLDADALAVASGVTRSDAARIARAFVDASKAAVVLAPPARGMCDVGLVAALSKLLCEVSGADRGFVGLAAAGNAAGAVGVVRKGDWQPVSAVVEGLISGKYKAIVNLDADLYESYPSDALKQAIEALEVSVSVSMFRGALEQTASTVLAASSWMESAGSACLYDGRESEWQSVGSPSWATRPVAEVVDALIVELGAAGAKSTARTTAAPHAAVDWLERIDAVLTASAVPQDRMVLVSIPGAGQSASGSVTGRITWAAAMFPAGFVEMSADDAASVGVADGDTVVLTSSAATMEACLRVTDRLRPGVAAVPSYDVNARRLFDWRPAQDDWFDTGPALIQVSRKLSS